MVDIKMHMKDFHTHVKGEIQNLENEKGIEQA